MRHLLFALLAVTAVTAADPPKADDKKAAMLAEVEKAIAALTDSKAEAKEKAAKQEKDEPQAAASASRATCGLVAAREFNGNGSSFRRPARSALLRCRR